VARSAFAGGVHPPAGKTATSGKPIERPPLPSKLFVPMSQHLGAPCEPTVAVGDRVVRGQLIGSVDAMVSAPVHAPASGVVDAIAPVLLTSGVRAPAVVIATDPDQDLEAFEPIAHAHDVRAAVRAAGIVGLGGAAFPSVVKLTPPKDMRLDLLIVNGCECEPRLTCDHRLMLEHAEQVVSGSKVVASAVGAERIVIAVEDDKPDAVEALRAAADGGVEVVALPVRYPQGGEKQLILAITGREVGHGQLPASVGALVHNVATIVAMLEAIENGRPLIERVVTVTGAVKRPGNYLTLLGTLVSDLIEAAGGLDGPVGRVVAGGPMTGAALGSLDVPIVKGTSGVLALRPDEAAPCVDGDQPCIRCRRCADACPMGLSPFALGTYADRRMWDKTSALHTLDCIECGCCSYVCPTQRPLVQLIRLAKAMALLQGAAL